VLVQIALPKPEEFSRLLFRIQQNQSAEVAASDAMAGGIPRATFPQRVHSLDVKNKDANFVAPTQDVEKAQAKKAIPDGYHTVTVQLTLDNAARAIDWYKKALGAEEVARAVGPDGKIMHAELRIGDSRIMMNDAILGGKGPKANGGSPAALWIYLGDCDALFNRAIGAGAQVKMPMADQFWGDRCGTFTDPHGYSWTIATRKEDLTHEEMLQRQEVFMKQFARPPAHA
jgi:PhnB protein